MISYYILKTRYFAEIRGSYWELRHENGLLEGIPLNAEYSGN